MNSKNSETSESDRFKLDLADKFNLKDQKKKKKALTNVFITPGKTSNQNTTTINLKFQLQHGRILLIYLMALILLWTFKITFNLSSKNTKL